MLVFDSRTAEHWLLHSAWTKSAKHHWYHRAPRSVQVQMFFGKGLAFFRIATWENQSQPRVQASLNDFPTSQLHGRARCFTESWLCNFLDVHNASPLSQTNHKITRQDSIKLHQMRWHFVRVRSGTGDWWISGSNWGWASWSSHNLRGVPCNDYLSTYPHSWHETRGS